MKELNTLHHGLSYEQYAAEPGVRASWLHKLKVSPQYFKATINQPDEDTPAKRLGKLIHSVFENGEKFRDEHVVEPVFTGMTKDGKPSTRSAEAINAKKEWYASLPPGTTVVTPDELDVLIGVANQIKNSRLLTNMLKSSIRESSLWVQDPDTGLTLQARPDFITQSGYCVDIKSTRQFAKDFPKEIFSDRYNSRFYILSAAHYVRCLSLAKISKTDNITLLAVETFPPYGIQCFNLDIGCIATGESWRDHLTKLYADCLKADRWPGYKDEVIGLTPPEFVSQPPEEEL